MPTNRRRDVLEDKTDMRSKADCGDQTIDERPAATEGNAIKEEEMTDVRPTIDSTEDTIDKGLVAIEGNTIKEEEMTFSKTLDIYYLWELHLTRYAEQNDLAFGSFESVPAASEALDSIRNALNLRLLNLQNALDTLVRLRVDSNFWQYLCTLDCNTKMSHLVPQLPTIIEGVRPFVGLTSPTPLDFTTGGTYYLDFLLGAVSGDSKSTRVLMEHIAREAELLIRAISSQEVPDLEARRQCHYQVRMATYDAHRFEFDTATRQWKTGRREFEQLNPKTHLADVTLAHEGLSLQESRLTLYESIVDACALRHPQAKVVLWAGLLEVLYLRMGTLAARYEPLAKCVSALWFHAGRPSLPFEKEEEEKGEKEEEQREIDTENSEK